MGKADKEKDGKPTVLKYLTAQNRPYSVNDITANLRNEIPKSMIQKILDALAEEGKIKEKANGKQKVYVVNQDDFPAASDAELRSAEAEINLLQNELNAVNAEIRGKEEKMRAFNSQLTTEEARLKVDEVKSEVAKLQAKLESLSGNAENMIDQDTMNKVKAEQGKAVKEWRKRKRMFDNVADAILEGYPHPKKAFYEEVGVETDADVGVVIPQN